MKIKLILITFTLLSCNSGRQAIRLDSEIWDRENSKQDFKDHVLCKCLLMGIGDKSIQNKFFEQDRSFYSPVNVVLFDSITKVILTPVLLKMKNDSVASLETVSEGAAGKKVFRDCLKFYKSKKLDSIAKSEIKKWAKLKNIDSIFSVKMPAY